MSSDIEMIHNSNDRLQNLLSSMDDEQLNIKADQIIGTMGGIRNVLINYIKTTQPSATEREQLSNILSPETSHRALSIPVNAEIDNNSDSPIAGDIDPSHTADPQTTQPLEQVGRTITLNVKRQQNKFVVYLNEQNDIWHWILSEDKQDIADKLVQFTLHSKWAFVYVVIAFILAIVCRFFIPMIQFIPATLAVLYGITSFFTFNLAMTKRMLKAFIFWFKMYNWLVAIVCYIMIFDAVWYIEGMNWIAGTMIVAGASLHDGWRLNKKIKIFMCFMVWVLALGIYAFVYFEGDPKLFGGAYVFEDKIHKVLGQEISTKSNCLNALFNILIFMGGQLAKMIKFKDKTSVLAVRPKVIWVENWSAMNNTLMNTSPQVSIIDLHQNS
eukprot:452430_1